MYTKKIYFSGGDFHELQEVFAELPGVLETKTGYINAMEQADYVGITSGVTEAYMGVEVNFNPKKIDICKLMDVFFAVVNPYIPDGQGKCRGKMYRCGVFYADDEDEPQIELHLNFIANRGKPPVASCEGLTLNDPNSNPRLTRHCYCLAEKLKNFSVAEEEHQNYLKKYPSAETYIDFPKLREYLRF